MAKALKDLGVKGPLIKAAELGYITELRCGMPKCFCPEELGGRVTSNRALTDGTTGSRPSSITQSRSEKGAARLSTTRSLLTASATSSTTSYAMGCPWRKILRESKASSRGGPPEARRGRPAPGRRARGAAPAEVARLVSPALASAGLSDGERRSYASVAQAASPMRLGLAQKRSLPVLAGTG